MRSLASRACRDMSTLALFLGVSVFSAAGQVSPPCDVNGKHARDVCDDFCNYRCGFYNTTLGDTGRPTNLTVYRITPRNVSGLLNKNTGDAPGDITFVISKKNLTQYCLHEPDGLGCHTDNANVDIYGVFVVEVDGQWGPYEMCNPADGWDTADWRCGLECIRPSHKDGCPRDRSQFGPARNGSNHGGGYTCWCDRTYKAAGREYAPGGGGISSYFPSDWPPQCGTGTYFPPMFSFGRCYTGEVLKVLQGWSEASALTMACKECEQDNQCSGWRLNADGKSATLFQGKLGHQWCKNSKHSAQKHVDRHSMGGGNWYGVGDFGGYWYSLTDGGGECKNGAPVGTDGCTWRLVETKAYKNATCVDGKADLAVEDYGKVCFDTCPKPLNRTTDCYLDCYRNILMGDASLNLTKLDTKLFVGPWEKALNEDDPAKGGCPPVKPSSDPVFDLAMLVV